MKALRLSGLQVTKIVYATGMPFVTHAQFVAENQSAAPITLAVHGVAVQLGDTIITIASYQLYLLPDYEEAPDAATALEPGAKYTFEVTFPRVPLAGHSINDGIQVRLTVVAGGVETLVISPVVFTIRTPRR